MDKEKELRETLLEIYRVKVCPVCKSFQECNESKRYGYEDFKVKVFEVKGEEKVFEYSCKSFQLSVPSKSFACNDLSKSFQLSVPCKSFQLSVPSKSFACNDFRYFKNYTL